MHTVPQLSSNNDNIPTEAKLFWFWFYVYKTLLIDDIVGTFTFFGKFEISWVVTSERTEWSSYWQSYIGHLDKFQINRNKFLWPSLWRLIPRKAQKIKTSNFDKIFIQDFNLCQQNLRSISLVVSKLCALQQFR